MVKISIVGIDLAKNVFQVHGEDAEGRPLFNKALSRVKFKPWLNTLPLCTIVMEACGSSHYWGRVCQSLGHEVKMINPKRVKGFLQGNKTDKNDAQAICEAAKSGYTRYIRVKSERQQTLGALHRTREQIKRRYVQQMNFVRSQLAEYGMVTRQGKASLFKLLAEVMSGEHLSLDETLSFLVLDWYEELRRMKDHLERYNREINRLAECESARRLMSLPGIGPITATALLAKIGDFREFKSGRQLAAYLGLTPREHSSGGRQQLGGITKRGDRYLRMLLIHGARSMLRAMKPSQTPETAYHRWVYGLRERCGEHKAMVALANKHVRMIWALMVHDRAVDLNDAQHYEVTVSC